MTQHQHHPLRLGMVGGGQGAFIGGVHRIAARLDGRIASRLIRDENRLVTIKAGDYALRIKK